MTEGMKEIGEQELAFLEAGERFLENPSETHWQDFYAYFKELIGPLDDFTASDNLDIQHGTFSRDHQSLRDVFFHVTKPRLKLSKGALMLMLGSFIVGILLGLSGAKLATDSQLTPDALMLRSDLAKPSSTLALTWMPISQVFQSTQMVLVPPGCWNMGRTDGSEAERPVQQSCIDKPFWLDRTEVIMGQFGSVDHAGCDMQGETVGPEDPANCVNWLEARAYCQQRGGRLPTEAEWEWAARGPDGLIYPWGDQFAADKAVVVSYAHTPTHAAPVGSIPTGASWVGAVDMSGNLWEWTSSIYDQVRFPYPYRANDGRENSQDLTSERVLRGGGWTDSSGEATTTYRGHATPDVAFKSYGFRCARDFTQ